MFFILLSSQATSLIDYHISCRLSTTFLFFLFRFCNFINHFQATACLLYHIQQPFVKNFFQVFLCIFHLTLSISRQGCPVFSILHRLSYRRRLSYHLVFELSTFFLFFIYFAQFRQFASFTNTVYKISLFLLPCTPNILLS